MRINEKLYKLFLKIESNGGKSYYVGGTVRDKLLGKEVKDYDIEVFGIQPRKLESLLSEIGPINYVGKSFGVYKVKGLPDYDFSLPRSEVKTGNKHNEFKVTFDEFMTPEEASKRRDFTINSLYMNTINGQILDFGSGIKDLKDRVLRVNNPKAFIEDPLRVLRGFQFAGRFGLTATQDTLDLCRALREQYRYLSTERVWSEWLKWAEKSEYPELGLQFLKDCGWLDTVPFLHKLEAVPQNADVHPEGNVWNHTYHVVKHMGQVSRGRDDRAILVFAALLHDIGKIYCTTENESGRLVTYGHDDVGAEKVRDFFKSIGGTNGIATLMSSYVEPLVKNHMYLSHKSNLSGKSVRRLADRLRPATIQQLAYVIQSDKSGRPPLPVTNPTVELLAEAEKLRIRESAPRRIVQGRDLIEAGFQPNKSFSSILDGLYELQLDGAFDTVEQGLKVLKNVLDIRPGM